MSEALSPQGEMSSSYSRERAVDEAFDAALTQFAYRGIIPVESVEIMKSYLGVSPDPLDTASQRLGIQSGDKIGMVLARKLHDDKDGFVSYPRPGMGQVKLVSDMLGNSRDGRAPIPRQEAVDKNRVYLLGELGFNMFGAEALAEGEPIPARSIDQSIVGVLSWLNQPLQRIYGAG